MLRHSGCLHSSAGLENPRNYALELLSYYLTARQTNDRVGKCSKAEAAPQPVNGQTAAGRHKEDP